MRSRTSPLTTPSAAVAPMLGRRDARRRGVILILTVVLLTLLAIMGTAFLATSRIDRQQVTGHGRLQVQPAASAAPLMRDATTLNSLHAAAERAVEGELVRDLFNVPRNLNLDGNLFASLAFGQFRQSLSTPGTPVSWYENYDAPGRADPWLSSLLPRRASTASNAPVWPWIGAPLGGSLGTQPASMGYDNGNGGSVPYAEPFFTDPRKLTAAGFSTTFNVGTKVDQFAAFNPAETSASAVAGDVAPLANTSLYRVTFRHNVAIGSLTLGRASATDTASTVRTYPAIVPGGLASTVAGHVLIAGDADGDGIADSGLAPIALNPQLATNRLERYLDPTNNVVYFVGYRVVDNGAKLNLGTALDNRGDVIEMSISSKNGGTAAIPVDENYDSGNHTATADALGTPGVAYSGISNNPGSGANPNANGTPPPELREYLTNDPTDARTTPAAGAIGPNYGFFRSNVGLTGVIRQLMQPMNQTPDAIGYNRAPFQSDLRLLIDARFPLLRKTPGPKYAQVSVGGTYAAGTSAPDDKDINKIATKFGLPAVGQWNLGRPYANGVSNPALFPKDYLFRSFGDLLENQAARRPLWPGGYLWAPIGPDSPPADNLEYRADAFAALDSTDAVALGARGASLRNPLLPPGRYESALQFSLSINTPNTTFNSEKPWAYFPANAPYLWFGWTQDFDVDPPLSTATDFLIRAIDDTTMTNRAYTWNAANDPMKPAGTQDVVLQRSPRALFTGYNGVTSVVPMREDRVEAGGGVTLPVPGLPIGMPAYAAADARDGVAGHSAAIPKSALGLDPSSGTNYFAYPNVKVSAATGTKEQLWRAFWSAMTVQVPFVTSGGYYGSMWDAARPMGTPGSPLASSSAWTNPTATQINPNQFYNAFRSSDRWSSNPFAAAQPASPNTSLGFLGAPAAGSYDERLRPTQTLSTRQMALLRSAVAACNTIDLRDGDNDITAMDVDLTDDNNATTRYYARVYGTEKQLVISAVFIEDASFVAVEVYNPTDVPIQLSAYRLALVDRSSATGNITNGSLALKTGSRPMRLGLRSTDKVLPGGYVVFEYGSAPNPGSYRGISSSSAHDGSDVPDVWYVNSAARVAPLAALVSSTNPATELVLFRTRRADGVPFTDATATPATGVRATIENEVAQNVENADDLAANTLVQTLVPVDEVDCRFQRNATLGSPSRWLYQRGRPNTRTDAGSASNPLLSGGNANDERDWAGRVFYSGRFYNLRPTAAGNRNPAVSASSTAVGDFAATAPLSDYAWREIKSTGGNRKIYIAPNPPGASENNNSIPIKTTSTFDVDMDRNEVTTVLAPAVPIQNFTPHDPYTQTQTRAVPTSTPPHHYNEVWGSAAYDAAVNNATSRGIRGVFHLLNRFPFGSPIARELDLQAIPYIGTYKIYRTSAAGPNATPVWAEFVPLPVDAWMVADSPTAAAQPSATPATNTAQTTTVGRFDPTITAYANEWSSSLTDFVSARHAPYQTYLPDVPSSETDATFFDTKGTSGAGPTTDQRYAQDGPITGSSATVNTFADTGWTRFVERNAGSSDASLTGIDRTGRRGGRADLAAGANPTLVQGLVNLNTAPSLVLRQLPWIVNYETGQVDFNNDSQTAQQLRRLVRTIDVRREDLARIAWTPTGATYNQSSGFPSLLDLSADNHNAPANSVTIGGVNTAAKPNPTRIADEISRIGTAANGTATAAARLDTVATVSADTTSTANANAMIRGGMLNPVNRPEAVANYLVSQLNANRVSNLTSTRSDVYTVYVTVQAWTWDAAGNGANQATRTRLVGERRSSFVVDRSQISQVRNKISDLIVLPIEKE